MDISSLSPVARRLFGMIEFDEGEKMLAEIHKHPFGLFLIYFTGLSVTIALLIIFVVLPSFIRGDLLGAGFDIATVEPVMVALGGILALLALIITAIGAYLYTNNVILVTSEKLAQVLYRTLFDRKISQLSIGDVQDVTVTQKGILAHLFNYGTLIIETAGEQQNLTFTFTPEPYEVSKVIVNSHEENLKQYGN